MTNKDGCKPFTDEDFFEEHLSERSKQGHRPIIMVSRGNCHFVEKAKNIEVFGGHLMIVVDNKKKERAEDFNMADDGRGSGVKIPSFFIGMEDGLKLKEAIHEDVELIMEDKKRIQKKMEEDLAAGLVVKDEDY